MAGADKPINELKTKDANDLALEDFLIGHDDGQPAAFRTPLAELVTALAQHLFGPGGALPIEEGSWTPEIGGTTSDPSVTYSNRAGRYLRLGPLVMLTFRVETSALSGGGGNIAIRGTPFTPRPEMAANGYGLGLADLSNFDLGTTVRSLSLRMLSSHIGIVMSRDSIGASFVPLTSWPTGVGGISHASIIYMTDDP